MKKIICLLLTLFFINFFGTSKNIKPKIKIHENVYKSPEDAFSDFKTNFSKTLLMIEDSDDKENFTNIYKSMINLSKLTGEKDERKSQIIFKNGDESLTITNTVATLKSALGNTVKTIVIYNMGGKGIYFYLPYNFDEQVDYDLLILIPNGGKKENVKQEIEEDFAPWRAIEVNTISNKISISDFYWD
ncbi:MAG: hypothetical protein K6E97_07445 [Treponema sp.]|nr:hypothetical protein [Treponema sp.]